jgi:UDP-N-acetylmuramoyl-tripeptide--D-alanyl-D-alanine ligase
MGWSYTATQLAEWIRCAAPVGKQKALTGISTDTRTIQPGDVYVALRGPNFDAESFVADAFAKGASAAICRSAHPEGPCLLVEDPLKALQRFASRHRMTLDVPVLAITGSCGKTTAKDLTSALLGTRYEVVKTPGNLNNEIGCPMSLLNMDRHTTFAVIEMGANHVGEIARLCGLARPTETAVTMVAPAHLEGFGSIESVAKAKAEIVDNLDADGRFYQNMDNPWCREMGQDFGGEFVRFGREGDVVLRSCEFNDTGELVLDIDPVGELRLPLPVKAHATNVLLAVAVGLQHGITDFEAPLREACLAGARFKVYSLGGLEILDDTYNANPASMEAALEALMGRKNRNSRIAVLGDMLELGEEAVDHHRSLGARAAAVGVDRLLSYGDHACDIIRGAQEAGLSDAEVFSSHEDIAAALHQVATPGDAILLKGSRGVCMERVADALKQLIAPDGEEYPAAP